MSNEVDFVEEDNDDDIPDVKICDQLCKDFAAITNTDVACAQFYLQDRKWDLERSVNDFFEDRLGGSKVKKMQGSNENEVEVVLVVDGSQESIAAAATAVLRNSSLKSQDKPTTSNVKSLGNSSTSNTNDVSAEFPEVFKFITWNIDGLDGKNLQIRTKAVSDYVKEVRADVIFFQEVIPKSEEYLKTNLKDYQFVFGGDREYYTGLAYNPNTVQYQLHSVEEFPDSMMGRNLLLFKANIGGSDVLFMNSHLESGGDHSDERKNQLRLSFQKMTECSSDLNVILAGDLNLRDKELNEIGGIPNGVRDAWLSCGERKECAYTWDMQRNDNTIINGKFKPRMRFDRIYYKSSTKAPVHATYFGLIGLSRLTPYTTFPSDHWGLLCFFKLNGNSVE